MKMTRLYLAALLLCCLMAPNEAAAHRLNVFAWLENDQILVECNFGQNRPARDAAVTVLDEADQKELLRGQTNGQGRYAFAVPDVVRQGHGLVISVDAGQGHKGEWTMNASELYAAASLSAGFEAAAIHKDQAPAAAAQNAAQLGEEQLRAILHAGLEQHLAPIRQQLAEQASKGPGLAEIIGGLGWIIGLAGIGLYFKSRRG